MKKFFLAAIAWIMPVITCAVTLWAGSGNPTLLRDDLEEKLEKEEKLMLSPEERMRLRARQHKQ